MSVGDGRRTDADRSASGSDAKWLPLDPGESVVWTGHPRLATVLPAVATGAVLVALTAALAVVVDDVRFAAVAVLGVVPPIWQYLVVTNTRYVVTDCALYRKAGVLSLDVRRVRLDRVQNSSFRQGVRGSLFDYGTVTVEAAGGDGLSFTDVDGPSTVRSLVEGRTTSSQGVPGTSTQWEAVLEDVRAWRRALERRTDGRNVDR